MKSYRASAAYHKGITCCSRLTTASLTLEVQEERATAEALFVEEQQTQTAHNETKQERNTSKYNKHPRKTSGATYSCGALTECCAAWTSQFITDIANLAT